MSRNRNTSDPLAKQSSISTISSHVPLLTPLSNVDQDNSVQHGTTDLQTFLDSMKTNTNRDSKRGRTICQPKGTIPYTVERNDTLEKIALHFNLTPSELIHLNKLNSRIVFPGQILYVPESISSEIPPTNVSPRAKENDVFLLHADRRLSGSESSSPPFISHLHQQQDVGPMIWSMTRQSAAKPGHAQRLKSETSIESETSSRTVEDRLKSQKEDNTKQVRQIQKTLSIDENRQLDEECLQRFLKVNVQLVTEDHKKINGVLLVTPNAVMFDPDVLDPAVKEYGIEKFGLIIRMDLLAGVAMYEDIGLYDHEVTTRDEEKRRICHSTSIKNLHQTSLKLIDIDDEQVRDVLSSILDQIEKDNEDNVLKVFDASSTHHLKTKNISTDISKSTTFNRDDLKHSIGILFNEQQTNVPDKSLFLDEFDERQYELQLENCVSLGDINKRFGEIDKLLQKQHEIYVAPHPIEIPYYLCLKTSSHTNEKASSTSSMDDVYGKKELDGEYWFSVPKEKVDHLYAFFLRWTPERESETNSNKNESTTIGTSQSSTHLTRSSSQHQTKSNEKLTKTKNAKGFVLLNPDDFESTEDYLLNDNKTSRARTATTTSTDSNQKEQKKSHYLNRQNTLLKEWEIINVEEIYRRINAAQANNAHLEDISAIPAPKLLQPSTLINEQQSKEILLELPARVHGLNWQLVFSTEQHGFSLNQLYRRGIESDLDTPALLIVRDVDQNIFGAYVSQQFTVSEGFYGTGESFLFTFHPEFQVFKWTGHNQFFIKGDVKALGIGCGEGIYGLWLDADLYHGRTCPSKTFNNARLTSKEDFIIASVEVWTFVD